MWLICSNDSTSLTSRSNVSLSITVLHAGLYLVTKPTPLALAGMMDLVWELSGKYLTWNVLLLLNLLVSSFAIFRTIANLQIFA